MDNLVVYTGHALDLLGLLRLVRLWRDQLQQMLHLVL
jgi:hypothetical protein